MRALFVHNSTFQFAGKRVYSNNIPANIWERYLLHFETLDVIGYGDDYTGDDVNSAELKNERVRFFRFPFISLQSEILRYKYYLRLAQTYLSTVDAIIVRLPSVVGAIFLQAARQANIPAAIEVVGSAWHEYLYRGTFKEKMLAPIRYKQMQSVIINSSHAIYVTKRFLQQFYPCNGFTANASNVDIKEINWKRTYTSETVFRITTVGTLDFFFKGQDVVLKALLLLEKQGYKDFVFNCVGDGTGQKIKELAGRLGISDRIRVIGSLSKDKLWTLLDNTELYIQPSRTEGLPRALVEAMSRGCAVLGSSAGGIPELLENRFLHTPGDEKKLAEDIKKVVNLSLEERTGIGLQNMELSSRYLAETLNCQRNIFWKDFYRHISCR